MQQRQPLPPSRPVAPLAPPAAPPLPAQARRKRRLAPVVVLLVVLIAGGAVIAGIVSRESNTLRLQKVVSDQVDQTVSKMQDMIRQNTQ